MALQLAELNSHVAPRAQRGPGEPVSGHIAEADPDDGVERSIRNPGTRRRTKPPHCGVCPDEAASAVRDIDMPTWPHGPDGIGEGETACWTTPHLSHGINLGHPAVSVANHSPCTRSSGNPERAILQAWPVPSSSHLDSLGA